MSLLPSTPAQESVSSSGVFPIRGLTESPRQVGKTFLGVGVGVSVGVISSASFRSSKVDRPDWATAITLKVTLTRRIRNSERLNDDFLLIFLIFCVWLS